jgi:uncharacterized protein YceK
MARTGKAMVDAAARQALLLLAALVVLSGCASIKNTAKEIKDGAPAIASARRPGSGDLKHKAAVVGLDPASAALPGGFAARFQTAISGALEKDCRNVFVDFDLAAGLKSPPRLPAGAIDGFALSLLGRRRGVNFFVFGGLVDIRSREEKTGFWLWKDTRYWLKTSVRVEIVDVETATKILDEIFWQETALDEVQHQQWQEGGRARLEDLKLPLEAILLKAAQRICATLRSQPWTGFVVGGDGRRLTLSAGRPSGLAVGRALEVFSAGPIIESKDGQRFFSPGARIGEAVVSEVSAEGAEAELPAAAASAAGGYVRLKP